VFDCVGTILTIVIAAYGFVRVVRVLWWNEDP